MTSTVIIEAHCGPDKQVRIAIGQHDSNKALEEIVIQNGQKHVVHIFDDRFVGACEEPKEPDFRQMVAKMSDQVLEKTAEGERYTRRSAEDIHD